MIRFNLLTSLVLLCLFTATAFGAASSQSAVTDWVVLSPKDEGFAVRMPVKPSEETDRVALVGNTYLMRLYLSTDSGSGLLYMALMQEFPSMVSVLEPAARLDKFIEGFKTGFGETLAKSRGVKFEMTTDGELNLAKHLGRQYKLKVGESPGLMRVFDGGRRVYFLLVMGADEKHADVNRFFSSFEIKPAPDPVPRPLSEAKPSPAN